MDKILGLILIFLNFIDQNVKPSEPFGTANYGMAFLIFRFIINSFFSTKYKNVTIKYNFVEVNVFSPGKKVSGHGWSI